MRIGAKPSLVPISVEVVSIQTMTLKADKEKVSALTVCVRGLLGPKCPENSWKRYLFNLLERYRARKGSRFIFRQYYRQTWSGDIEEVWWRVKRGCGGFSLLVEYSNGHGIVSWSDMANACMDSLSVMDEYSLRFAPRKSHMMSLFAYNNRTDNRIRFPRLTAYGPQEQCG